MESNVSIALILSGSAIVIVLVLLIIVLVMWGKLKAMRGKYEGMMGQTGISNLQEVIIDLQNRLNEQQARGEWNSQNIQAIQERIAAIKGNLSIIRYNAFSEKGQGSDLSFSLAIVDDAKNGAVLTGIFGRDESYMYGKPLEQGESKYPLTPEEKEVIQLSTANLKRKGGE